MRSLLRDRYSPHVQRALSFATVLEAARAALALAIVSVGPRIPEKARRGRKRKGEAA